MSTPLRAAAAQRERERGSGREQWERGLCFRVRECSARACVCVCVTYFYSWTHLIISIETFRCVCVCESVCACRCDISKKLFVLHFDRQFANFLCSDASSASVAQLFRRTLPTTHPTPSRAEHSTLATFGWHLSSNTCNALTLAHTQTHTSVCAMPTLCLAVFYADHAAAVVVAITVAAGALIWLNFLIYKHCACRL